MFTSGRWGFIWSYWLLLFLKQNHPVRQQCLQGTADFRYPGRWCNTSRRTGTVVELWNTVQICLCLGRYTTYLSFLPIGWSAELRPKIPQIWTTDLTASSAFTLCNCTFEGNLVMLFNGMPCYFLLRCQEDLAQKCVVVRHRLWCHCVCNIYPREGSVSFVGHILKLSCCMCITETLLTYLPILIYISAFLLLTSFNYLSTWG